MVESTLESVLNEVGGDPDWVNDIREATPEERDDWAKQFWMKRYPGELSVLNVGAGDINITFNNADADEVGRARQVISDMQKAGYAIMVQMPDKSYQRIADFDPARNAYVVVVPQVEAAPLVEAVPDAEVLPKRRGRKKGQRKGVGFDHVALPVQQTRAVGIARSAGG